ncbi:MAG: hypothetical protein CMM56_04130 [Rhodospirillaceae bacterium]|nr:hypothetical protein [Rhodospirillaceae bacterium]|tara:strand:+ start:4414 stop:5028 length:615 start_codon:yes stop_codon:yes gene_type:complete
MSFILDALRKSENERQQSTAPRLSSATPIVHRNKAPRWMLLMMAGLTAATMFLGWAWLTEMSSQDNNIGDSVVDHLAQNTDPINEEINGRTEQKISLDQTTNFSQQPLITDNPSIDSTITSTDSTSATVSIPLMADLVSYGMQMPDLNIELHVFSEDSANRFVFINSSKYLEGENIDEETRVQEISENGVVIAYKDQLFLLPQQ